MSELSPGLVLVHGNRVEQLRDILLAWLRHNPLDVLENESVLVQSNAIAQWLRLALADRDTGCGIAAGLEFLLPARFMWQAYRAVLGPAAVPESSPLDKNALVWRLMRLLPGLLEQPAFQDLARFLANDADARRLYQLARRLADLYDQYQVYRSDWLQAWSQGQAMLFDAHGRQQPVPAQQAWQVHLWQALLADIARPDQLAGRAAVHAAFMEKTGSPSGMQRPAGLPRRLLVFGISAMPRQILEALSGLARWMQIMVFVHNPCAHYWADIQGGHELLRARFRRQARRPDSPVPLAADALYSASHPLLASWGRQGRDFISQLDDIDDPGFRQHWGQRFAALHKRIDAFESLPGSTLLEQLQDDIHDLRPPHETRQRWPAVDVRTDDSICFHIAHSPQREVEILHDQLLAAFEADPGLQARDIIVMVPDIEVYAPHIQAVFGLYDIHDRRHIPYALADRSQRRADPLARVLEQLLSLPRLRFGVRQLLDWLELPALRSRFGIRADELHRLRRWVHESCIRWGLHAEHKASFGLELDPSMAEANTWLFGLRRMLLGYAGGPGRGQWKGIEPYDQVSGLEAGLLGSLARLLDTLDGYWQLLRTDATPQEWAVHLQAMLDDFLLPQDSREAGLILRFREILHDWLDLCNQAGLVDPIPCSLVAGHCLAELDQDNHSQRFFAGAVTFATMMPMRAIPFRRVCLLGMHDGAFPRQRIAADFDLMGKFPRPGDRSRREDDRYMFLEALLSARDQLYISWVGRSIVDNSEQPPSVLLAQLQGHLDACWRAADGSPSLSAALSTVHPMQPFSPRYFQPDSGGHDKLFTYAAEWRATHNGVPAIARQDALPQSALESGPDLRELRQFLRHPVRAFFQQRLLLRLEQYEQELDENEPFNPDGLQLWQFRNEILTTVQQADDPEASLAGLLGQMQRRGSLPAGALGDAMAQTLESSVLPAIESWAYACMLWPHVEPDPLLMQGALPVGDGGTDFRDSLAGWRRNDAGNYSRIVLQAANLVGDSKNSWRFDAMLAAWLGHVAGHVYGRPHETILISPKGSVCFAPLEGADGLWQAYWHAWFQGLCHPLPVELRAAGAWLRHGGAGGSQDTALARAAEAYALELEHDLYLRRTYPGFDVLCADGGFVHWAERLYGDLNRAISSWSPAPHKQEAA